MDRAQAVRTVKTRLPNWLRCPDGIADSTRWLFGGLVLITLVLQLPAPLASGRSAVAAVALASAAVLACLWIYTYRTKRLPFWMDLLVAASLTGIALTCPEPPAVFPLAFAAVWFSALYGSTLRSLARCGLYIAGVAASLPLWHLIPGHTTVPHVALVLGAAPAMVLTVLVGRHLATGLEAREQSIRRDAALAVLGSRLLAVTDIATIRGLAIATAREICTATPGLRLLQAVSDGVVLRVQGAAGTFAEVPATLPGATVVPNGRLPESVADTALLDAAVGAVLQWACLQIDDDPDAGLMLLGIPNRIPPSALLAARSLLIMMALALRNSGAHQELTVQATVDSLTGLANRAAFSGALSSALGRNTDVNPVHLLFIDLDDFKDINDGLGHHAGDEVLTEVAVRMRACTRSADMCARLGGDEFAVILINTAAAEATDVAQRIVRALSEPMLLTAGTAQIGASVGIASADVHAARGLISAGAPNGTELRRQADVAMYAAKAHGKGQIQWFDTTLLAPALDS